MIEILRLRCLSIAVNPAAYQVEIGKCLKGGK